MAYEEQVSAGIARLDLEFGSREAWAERITEPLDLSHGRKCVLGQLYGEYWNGIDILWPRDVSETGMNEQAAEAVLHGFNVPLSDGEEVEDRFDDYDKLTAEWVRQLDL